MKLHNVHVLFFILYCATNSHLMHNNSGTRLLATLHTGSTRASLHENKHTKSPQVAMASMEELASALEDTQESLAAALARVEALRSREKNLVQDNARLRTRLRDLGVSEEDVGVTPKKDNTRTVDSPRSGEGQDSGESAGEELDSAGFLNEETQQHPVYIHTSSGKVVWRLG